MKARIRITLCLALAWAATAADGPVTLTVKLSKAELINPHSTLAFTVEGAQMTGSQWVCKVGPMSKMEKGWGWTEDALGAGEEVTIQGNLKKHDAQLSIKTVEKESTHVKLEKKASDAPAFDCNRQSVPVK
jgi:hypothetical protein